MQNTFSAIDYLHHIVDECEFIIQHSKYLDFDKFQENLMLQKAFFRSLEVVGEATKNISFPFREKYPAIQWREIAGMRDKLIHHYFDVDIQVVFDTCVVDIPDLAFNIKAILLLEENKNKNPTQS